MKPCKNIYQQQPLNLTKSHENGSFCNKPFFSLRYVAKPHAAPVCRPVQGFSQRLPSIPSGRGHYEPTQLRYSPLFLLRKTMCNVLKYEPSSRISWKKSPIKICQMRFDAVTAKLYKVEHVKSNLHNIASTLKLDNLVGT